MMGKDLPQEHYSQESQKVILISDKNEILEHGRLPGIKKINT